jgi:hypothetical protein
MATVKDPYRQGPSTVKLFTVVINNVTWDQSYKTFYVRNLRSFVISWGVCPSGISSLGLCLRVRLGASLALKYRAMEMTESDKHTRGRIFSRV